MSKLLADLNDKQQEAVVATEGPVLILAGAGSGKTRALTYRLAYLIEQKIARPEELLAMTFTNKAAGEMKERVAKLVSGISRPPNSVGTFHGMGARIMREQAKFLPRSNSFTILDAGDSERIVRLALDQLNMDRKEYSPKSIKYKISEAKNKRWSPKDMLEAVHRPDEEAAAMTYARYEKILAQQDAYDFDDLLITPIALMEKYPQTREYYQRRWKYLSVDEYQDTNPPQDYLLQLLVGKENNICAVGDDYQAIYSWRGAKVDHILNFERKYPQTKVVYLTQNYRSTGGILQAANKVISANVKQMHKKLWTDASRGRPVRVVEMASGRGEAAWVRQKIEEAVSDGKRRRECVVVYRTNAQSRAFEEEFLTNNIPYTIVGGFRFYERREIKDALALLQWWVNPKSRLSVQRISDALWRGIGPKTIENWSRDAELRGMTIRDYLEANMSRWPQISRVMKIYAGSQDPKQVAKLLEFLIKNSGYHDWLKKLVDGEERIENVDELLRVASGYDSVDQFLEDVALFTDIDTLESDHDRVTCMTLHAAKGLEYQRVYIVGCEEGLLPHSNSVNKTADIEEERRLLYVGMTRARVELNLCFARTRWTRGEVLPQMPSRFLDDLPDSVERIEVADTTANWSPKKTMDAGQAIDDFGLLTGEDDEPVVVSVEEGDFVQHKSFGKGVVIGSSGKYVTCIFEGYGVKTFYGESLAEIIR